MIMITWGVMGGHFVEHNYLLSAANSNKSTYQPAIYMPTCMALYKIL